jgi:C1A family cysteine protease
MASVDLRAKFGPIEQQGLPNSCVAHAATSVVEAVLGVSDLSRLFVYWNARSYANQTGGDFGCQPRNAMKGLSQYGAPAETAWPYDTTKIVTKPDANAYNVAQPLRTKIKAYQSVQSFAAMKTALTQGLPVLFALMVPDTFASVTKYSGVQPGIAATTRWIGSHCMVACGFDDATQMVLVRNSFGTGFGQEGYCWFGYEWFANVTTGKVTDCWTILPV